MSLTIILVNYTVTLRTCIRNFKAVVCATILARQQPRDPRPTMHSAHMADKPGSDWILRHLAESCIDVLIDGCSHRGSPGAGDQQKIILADE